MKLKKLLYFAVVLFCFQLQAQNYAVNGDFESGGNGTGFNVTGAGYTQLSPPYAGITVPGNYAFTTSAQQVNSTFAAGGDHTTGTGNMMVVVGDATPGIQYFWSAGNTGAGICGLTPGTVYRFSYWIKSLQATTTAQTAVIQLDVTGATAPTLVSGTAAAPALASGWQQVVYTFTANNACVGINLGDTTASATGNSFAIDDVRLSAPLTVTNSATPISCTQANDAAIVAYGANGTPPYVTYNLTGSATQSNTTGVFTGLSAGTYSVSVTDSAGTTATKNNILIAPALDLTVTPSTTICSGTNKQLTVTGGSTYVWTASPADPTLTAPTSATPTVAPTQNTVYTVTSTITSTPELITNGNFSQGNSGFNSDYNYTGNNATNADRYYGVVTNALGWAPAFAACTDHTGGGPMLIVTGSPVNAGNDRVWRQNVTVAAGGAYTFSYWIQNLAGSNAPNIEVTINGTSIGIQPASATSACGNWVQRTYTWNSGTATAADIVIFDRTTTAAGNDFAIDDISFSKSQSCTLTKSVTIKVVSTLTAVLEAPLTSICPGYSAQITVTGTPDTTISYTSPAGNGNVILDATGHGVISPFVTQTTTFTLTTATNGSCTNALTGSATINVLPTGSCPTPKIEVDIDNPAAVCYPGQPTTLSAKYFQPKPTTDYTVKSIPYQNLYPFTGGTILTTNNDDVWSPLYTLPFNFCFYNQTLKDVLVGSNGLISFNLALNSGGPGTGIPGGNEVPSALGTSGPSPGCDWSISQAIPSAAFNEKLAILGVYQDTDINPSRPGLTNPAIQNVNYYVGGTAPNRYFVANFNELPQFSCNAGVGLQTSQIVIYESTNVIDVYVLKRTPCPGWQSGAGVIGVINQSGTVATAAPGRNTGGWSTTNEAWRFYPSGAGPTNITVEWTNTAGTVISTEDKVVVAPTGPETYCVKITYTRCDGQVIIANKCINLNVETPFGLGTPQDKTLCGSNGPFNIAQDALILNGLSPADYEVLYYPTEADAKDYSPDYIPDPTNYTPPSLPFTVWVRVTDLASGTNCPNFKTFKLDSFFPGGTISYPSPTYNVNTPTTAVITNSPDLEPGGTYTATPAGLTIDPVTGDVNVGASAVGTYTVTYTVTQGGCPPYSTSTTIILDVSCTVAAPADFAVCEGDTFNLTAVNGDPSATFSWTGPNGFTSTSQNPTNVAAPTPAGVYTYTVTVTSAGVVCATDSVDVTVNPKPVGSFVTPSSTICSGTTATITVIGTQGSTVTITENGTPIAITVSTPDASGLQTGSITSPVVTTGTPVVYELVKAESNTTPNCVTNYPPGTTITISAGNPDATLTINDTTVCSNNPAGFTITGTPNATVNYTVDGTALSTTLDASGSSVLATTALAAGTTTITLVDVTSNSTPSCTKTLTGQTGTVTVIAEPTAGFTTPSPICSGTPATISFTGTPNSSVTFNDSQSNQTVAIDATGTGTYTTPFNITTTTTFTLISVTSGTTPSCLKNLSATISVSVNDLPVITQQPQSAVVCNGQPVTFTVVATGAGLTYQWYKTSLANPIASATSATYTIASPTTADIGDYFVVVSGTCSPAATSSLANLSVNQPTVITAQPAGGTYCEGDTVTLSVTATGVNLSYQWFGPNGAAITGATSPAYTITGITTAEAGSYHVDVINTCQTVSSNTVSVIVNQLPVITAQPTGVTVCQGQPVTLTASATGTGLTYQWENTTTGFTYPVSASPTLTIPVSALSDNGVFVLTVSGACPPSVTTTPVTVTVNQGPAITTQPAASTTLCEGQPFSISVTATGSNLTYQWYGPNGAAIAGATTPAYSIAAVTTADAGNYYVTVGNTDCPVITSATAVLQVNTLPVITAQPSGVTVCENDTITLTAAATGTALTYLWTNSTTGQTYVTATPVLTITPATLADNGTYILAVSGACAPSVSTTPVQVVVNDAPAITTQPAASTVLCSGQALTLSVTATGSNLTYQWYRDTTLLTGETSPTLYIASTAVGDTGNYTVHVNGTGCPEVVSSVAAVTINQAPAITDQPDSLEICVNEPVTLSVSTSGSNLTYQWQKNNVDIPGATLSSYNIPTAQVSDSGNYRVVVSSASCPSITSAVAVVIVNPLPVASISNGTTSTICADDLADVIFTGTPNAVVSYTINGGAVETVTISPTGSTIVSTGQVSSTVTYELVSVTTGSAPLCTAPLSGTPNSVATVTVNPMPIVSLPQDGYICIDSVTGTQLAPFYTFESGLDPGRYSFQWYFNGDAIVGANGPDYAPPAEGQYRLEVTDLVTGCMGGATAPIVSSSPPVAITAAEVTTGYFEGNATVVVTVDPAGEYEYRLDDGPWQTSNTFTGIHSVQDRLYTGVHTVYARDLKACDQVEYQVFIVDYPKYFTPNGDGIHDTWNIPALSAQNASIFIFDRFGKLLKQISTNGASNGWDGTYNGHAEPADDYWFVIKYSENSVEKEFKAHFALKR